MKHESLEKFKKRVVFEAILNSAVWGLIFGGVASFAIIGILLLCGVKIIWLDIVLLILGISIGGAGFYFLKFRPKGNKIASRVDSIGLDNRAEAMVENVNNDSPMARLQREDAKNVLQSTSPKRYKIKVGLFAIIVASLVMTSVSVGTALIPPRNVEAKIIPGPDESSTSIDPYDSSSSEEDMDKFDEIIARLLEELREIIDEAQVSDELKDLLYQIVDDLEVRLAEETNIEIKIEMIEEAREEILRLIAEALAKYDIGHAMMLYDWTTDLGRMIIRATSDMYLAIPENFDPIFDALQQAVLNAENFDEAVDALREILKNVLDKAEYEENEALIEAVENFRVNLLSAFTEDDLIAVLDTAEEEIMAALWHDDTIPQDKDKSEEEEEMEEMADSIDQAIDQAIEEMKESQDEQSSDQQSSEPWEDAEANPQPNPKDDPIEGETVIDGETQYLDVWEEYYQAIMEMLANGEEITDEMREFIEKYLAMLK